MSLTATRCTSAHCSIYLALLPSGPDAVRRLRLHRVRAAVRLTQNASLSYVAIDGPPKGGPDWRPLREKVFAQRFVKTDGRVKLVNRDVLMVGMGDVDRAGTDQNRRSPIRELRHVRRVRKDGGFES